MKQRILFFLLLSISTLYAQEGLFFPAQLDSSQLSKLAIAPTLLHLPTQTSLTDAIVQVGTNCTGTLISAKGLVLTHSDCVRPLLNDNEAHWQAENQQTERRVLGLELRFERSMELLGAEWTTYEPKERNQRIQKLIQQKRRELGYGYEVEIKPLYAGNQWAIFVYEVFRDVRLLILADEVAVLRLYANAKNQGSSYHPSNRPYQSPIHLAFSEQSKHRMEMVLGFPVYSQRNLSYYELEANFQYLNAFHTTLNQSMEYQVQTYRKRFPQAAAYLATKDTIAWKPNETIEAQSQAAYQVFVQKRAVIPAQFQERDAFNEWMEAWREVEMRRLLMAGLWESEAIQYGMQFVESRNELREAEELQTLIEPMAAAYPSFQTRFFPEVDQQFLRSAVMMYYQKMPDDPFCRFVSESAKKGDEWTIRMSNWVDKLYAKSIFSQPKKMKRFWKRPKMRKLQSDPIYQLCEELQRSYDALIPERNRLIQERAKLRLSYFQAALLESPELTAEANASLRISISLNQALDLLKGHEGAAILDEAGNIQGMITKTHPQALYLYQPEYKQITTAEIWANLQQLSYIQTEILRQKR